MFDELNAARPLADSPPSETPTIIIFVVVCILIGLVCLYCARVRLRNKLERMLRVAQASRSYKFQTGGYADQRYPAFGQAEAVVTRALQALNDGNFSHADELCREAENYLSGVPSLLLESVQKRADGVHQPSAVE